MWFWISVTMAAQSWFTWALSTPHPKLLASLTASPSSAAWCISFLGMQPTLTQVPPSPQLLPAGLGFTKSHTATFLPSMAASLLADRPPDPPPITMMS